jgi:hypothetical protein
MTRGSIIAVALLAAALPAGAATPQEVPPDADPGAAVPSARAPRPAPPRFPRITTPPLGLSPPAEAPQAGRGDPAPMPNRSIEAPRDRFANSLDPKLEPMLLPPERRQGVTFGREHLRETGPDRPFDSFVPGARLRIPFEQAPQR